MHMDKEDFERMIIENHEKIGKMSEIIEELAKIIHEEPNEEKPKKGFFESMME